MSGLFGGTPKPQQVQPSPAPQINTDPGDKNTEALRRAARASLIATSGQGVLGEAKTGRNQILGN